MFSLNDKQPLQILKVVASITAFILATIFLYWQNFQWLYSQWTNDKAYSHGFLVPLVSLYVAWLHRDFLLTFPPKPLKLPGYLSVCLCLLLLLIGRVGAFVQFEALSFFLIIPSCVLLLFGLQHLKLLFFPIIYLQFMIPWLDPILEKIHTPFQVVSAIIGTTFLKIIYPVHRDDLFIYLPNISLVVAEECSGINFLISVIAVGFPLVYFFQKTWPRAVSVIIIGSILTLFFNGLRVAIAGYCGQNYSPELLHGPGHIFQGWLVAWIGWVGLLIVSWLFRKIPYNRGEPKCHLYERLGHNEFEIHPLLNDRRPFQFHFFTLLFLLFGFSFYINYLAIPKPVPLRTPLSQLPAEFADWKGTQNNRIGIDKFFPSLDDELSREYRDSSGNSVYVFVGYFQKQDNEKKMVSYLSKPLHNNTETISVQQNHSSFQAIFSSQSVNLSNLAVLFWYQFPDEIKIISRLHVKLHTIRSGILQGRTNGAIILLATPEESYKGKSLTILQSFATDFEPFINKFIK